MNWLRIARVGRGYSLRALAEMLGTYPSRLWRIECGFARPTYMETAHLSTRLGILHEAMFCLPPRFSNPRTALEMVLHQLEPFQRAKPKVTCLIEQARREIGEV